MFEQGNGNRWKFKQIYGNTYSTYIIGNIEKIFF